MTWLVQFDSCDKNEGIRGEKRGGRDQSRDQTGEQ